MYSAYFLINVGIITLHPSKAFSFSREKKIFSLCQFLFPNKINTIFKTHNFSMNNYFNTINLFSLTMKCVLPEVAQKLEHWEHFKLHAAVSLFTRCWPSLYVKHSQEGNPQAPQQLT